MSRKLKVIGLSLVAVCALGAASASAQVSQFTVSSGSGAIATSTAVTSTNLELTVTGLLNLTCTGLNVEGGSVTSGTDAGSATSLSFTGCSVDSTKGVAQTGCVVKNTGGTAGTIATGGLTATLVKIGTAGYVTFAPTGTEFVNITISAASGKTCALSGAYPVTGQALVKIVSPANGVLATNVELESSQAIQETGGADHLKFEGRESFLDGKVDLHLASDLNWGYDL
jgi:hypothetical protein